VSQYMHKMYDNAPLHDAQRKLVKSTNELGITPLEAALRWVKYHSALQEGDGIILGASKEVQIVK
jgi:aflatoxin B1 aldehyde reductase